MFSRKVTNCCQSAEHNPHDMLSLQGIEYVELCQTKTLESIQTAGALPISCTATGSFNHQLDSTVAPAQHTKDTSCIHLPYTQFTSLSNGAGNRYQLV